MKKLVYSIFLGLFLTLTACHSINNGLTALSKCCKALSLANIEKMPEGRNKEPESSKGSALLPINSWDGKMMIW